MPRQVLRGPQCQLDAGGAGDDAHRLERVARLDRPPWTPRARLFTQTGQHHADVLRLARQRRVECRDLLVGGPAFVRNAFDGTGFRGGLDHLGDRVQRNVDRPAGHVAPQGFQQAGQQRRRQLRPVGFQRVEHQRGIAARIVGGQTPLVEHCRRKERRRQDLDITAERQRFPDGAAALLGRGEAASGRRLRQHRRDDLEALQPQHFLDEVGGLAQIGPPARRGRRHAVAVDHHVGADLGQPALGGAVGVVDACGAVRQVDGHADRRLRPVRRAAGHRASRSTWVRLCRLRYRPTAWRPGQALRRRRPDRLSARSGGPTRWSGGAGAGSATPPRGPTPPPRA